MRLTPFIIAAAITGAATSALAQTSPAPAPLRREAATEVSRPAAAAPTVAPSATAPAPLVVLFPSGSATVPSTEFAVLDHAARLFRDGNPLVMTVSGGTDSVGSATTNLALSEQRADSVLRELIARGIPAQRFQVLAKGITDPSVPAPVGMPEPNNRRVEISWR